MLTFTGTRIKFYGILMLLQGVIILKIFVRKGGCFVRYLPFISCDDGSCWPYIWPIKTRSLRRIRVLYLKWITNDHCDASRLWLSL